MLQNAPFKFFSLSACFRTPQANVWLRHVSQAASQHATHPAPPLANPAYAHGLQLRNVFEEMHL